ncbi:hypothetical protein [Tenacibaculum sp.]|uniref:hypothetical protein n=1 Tax=Tenacibaculum sp. TaxID=1906242 RepID=UPI003AA7CAA7
MITPVIKKYKYTIANILIIISLAIFLWQNSKTKSVYLLYTDDISECKNISQYEKSRYPLCNSKGDLFVFNKKKDQNTRLIKSLDKIKLLSKEDFFNSNLKNTNIFLVVKRAKEYEVIPVKMFQIVS